MFARNVALLAAVAGTVAAAAPAAHAAKKVNPCALATPGQVQMVSGNAVGAGKLKKAPGPAGKTTDLCLFNVPGNQVSAVIIQVTTSKDAAKSFAAGQKSLPSKPLSGIGSKAYQVTDAGTVGFLYKHWYVIVQPSYTPEPGIDLSKVPDLAKVVFSSLKSYK